MTNHERISINSKFLNHVPQEVINSALDIASNIPCMYQSHRTAVLDEIIALIAEKEKENQNA